MARSSPCAASTTSADARQQPLTRTFFASVVAKDGTPVTDLTAADVEVKEGGKLQSITSMRITTMPLRLHIIVSDGGTGAFQLGVLRLAQTLARAGPVEFAFTSVLIQPTRVTDFTDNVEAIGAGIEKLGRRGSVQGGNQLMEAIMSAMENIAAPGKRPVLIVLRIGNEGTSPISANSVREALRRTGTTLYVVSRAGASKAAPSYSRAGSDSNTGEVAQRQMDDAEMADTALNLNLVLGDGSRESGGYQQEIVLTTTVATLEQLASQIKNQYRDHLHAARRRQTERSVAGNSQAQGRDAARPGEDSQLTVEVPVEGLASVSKGVSMSSVRRRYLGLASAGLLAVAGCSGGAPEWAAKNQRVIDQHKVTGRTRDLPAVTVPNVLVPGVPVENATLPTATLAPGVVARLAWGRGALLEQVDMQPGATLPEQTLGEELILLGRDGSATIEFDGKTVDVARDSVLYLQPGAKRSVKAGPNGWKAFEVYSPIRLDHLALAGQNTSGVNVTFPDQGVTPSLQPGVVVNFNDIQWTPLTNPDPSRSYRRSTGHSRLIWGKNAQISFVRMDPGGEFPLHIHPEDQLTHTVRGSADQGVMDATTPVSGEAANMLFVPGGMVHSAKLGPHGADQFDVFWPVRPDYIERAQKLQALYDQVVPAGARPAKLADGFTFAEGPTWLKGQLYFSDMFFANPAAGDWTGSPARSRLIAMTPDGKWRALVARHAVERHHRRSQRQPHRLRHVRSPRRRSGPGERARGACRARQGEWQADRWAERPGHGREGRALHHRPAVHARGPEEPAGEAGVLRRARRYGQGRDRRGRIRDAERRRAVTGWENALREQHVGAAGRELRLGVRRRR